MTRIFLIFTLLLCGCTIARYGENFENHASHIEKDYNKPFDELYSCMMATGTMTSDQSTYSTPSMAVYEYTGFVKVVLKKTGPQKTHVRASAIRPHYDPEYAISTLNKCAKS